MCAQPTNIQTPKVEYRQGIYYPVLDGKTPYERGYQHGAALEFPIKKALRQFKAWIRQNVGLDDPEEMILDFAESTPYMASVQTDLPDLYAEMQGIAEGYPSKPPADVMRTALLQPPGGGRMWRWSTKNGNEICPLIEINCFREIFEVSNLLGVDT